MSSLIRFCVCAVLLFASFASHAVFPTQSGWQTGSSQYGGQFTAITKQAACDAWSGPFDAKIRTLGYVYGGYTVKVDESTCRGWSKNSTGGNDQVIVQSGFTSVGGLCPANSTAVSGGCQCNSGAYEDPTHTSCVVPTPDTLQEFCLQGSTGKFTWPQSGTVGASSPLPTGSCYKPYPPFTGADATRGCTTALVNSMAVPKEGDPLLRQWSGTGVMTGAVCDDAAATDAAPKAADDPCPGGFQGTVNGESKCVPAEPDKGIEGVKTTSQTNADGSKSTTTETTKCAGSVCTTTTQIANTSAGGTITNSTSSRTESLEDKCVKDPKNPVCKKTQGGAGSAASEMTCDINPSAEGCGGQGAAIGELYAKKDKTVGQALKKATDALQASPVGSAVGGFFTVGSGGSCPTASATIPFLNKVVTFDMFCTTFAGQMFIIVKAVLLMLATWMAFRIAIDH